MKFDAEVKVNIKCLTQEETEFSKEDMLEFFKDKETIRSYKKSIIEDFKTFFDDEFGEGKYELTYVARFKNSETKEKIAEIRDKI